MAAKKIAVEIPEAHAKAETADQDLGIMKVIRPDGYAVCGNCGVQLVNVEERIKCKYCWNCGKKVRWK